MSKGSRQRPVDKAKFDAAWDKIFCKESKERKARKLKPAKREGKS